MQLIIKKRKTILIYLDCQYQITISDKLELYNYRYLIYQYLIKKK